MARHQSTAPPPPMCGADAPARIGTDRVRDGYLTARERVAIAAVLDALAVEPAYAQLSFELLQAHTDAKVALRQVRGRFR